MRKSEIKRKTNEVDINGNFNIDGSGLPYLLWSHRVGVDGSTETNMSDRDSRTQQPSDSVLEKMLRRILWLLPVLMIVVAIAIALVDPDGANSGLRKRAIVFVMGVIPASITLGIGLWVISLVRRRRS